MLPTLERLIWGERNWCRLGDKPSSLSVPKELKVCLAWWGQYRDPSPASRLNPAQNTSALLVGAEGSANTGFSSIQATNSASAWHQTPGRALGTRRTNRTLASRVWGRPRATVPWETRVLTSARDSIGEAVTTTRVRDGIAGGVSCTLKHGGTGQRRDLVTVKTLGCHLSPEHPYPPQPSPRCPA